MRRKKKNNQSITALFFILILCIAVYYVFLKPSFSLDEMEKRAVWISYIDLDKLDYSSMSSFENDFENICKISSDYYCNTIIVHTRAFQDSLYSSKSFPVSKIITDKDINFDPLDIMIEIAHRYNLKFEAWINPYRISFNQSTYNQFVHTSPIKDWINTEHIIRYGDYDCILNPGSSTARKYIINGVEEIIENYDVDGIHFDDYFYVDGTYQGLSEEQRKHNVNLLIKEVYKTIKNKDNNIEFGISPQGNYENCLLGGADVDTWLSQEGYIDYLMPQIYWTDEYYKNGKIKMFSNRVHLWKKLNRHSHVNLYVGLALYQSGKELSNDKGWSLSDNNISNQINILYNNGIMGYSLFHYNSLLNEGKNEMNNLFIDHPYN